MSSHPHYDGEDYRCIVLGGIASPGVATLRGHNRYPNWEIQQSRGADGGTTIRGGDPPGQFEAQFDLNDLDPGPLGDLAQWEAFQKLIESTTAGPIPFALPIYHPDLARNKFTEVSNGGVGGAIHSGKGRVTYIVKFIEYRPPKPKRTTKAVPTPGAPGGIKPDPNAAAKAQLNALLDEAAQP